MRFILSLLAVLALAVAVFAKDDVIDCRKKNRDIEQAINYMCGWTYDLKVPSTQGQFGKFSKNGKIFVQISGTCKPPQWVPRKYCMKQLFGMCARSARKGGNGTGTAYYGRNKCQKWGIAKA